MKEISRIARRVSMVMLIAANLPSVLSGQAPRVPEATVILVDALPATATALVIRRPKVQADDPTDVILVTQRTTAAELARAVHVLIRSRQRGGKTVAREMRASIGHVATPRQPGADHHTATLDLARIQSAPVTQVRGIATGRTLKIMLFTIPERKP